LSSLRGDDDGRGEFQQEVAVMILPRSHTSKFQYRLRPEMQQSSGNIGAKNRHLNNGTYCGLINVPLFQKVKL